MPYQFLDANASVLTADSSVVSGVIQRTAVDIASILSAVPVTFSGAPSVSGLVGASIVGQLPKGDQIIGAVAASISGLVNTSGSIAGTYTEQNVATSVVGVAVMFKNNVSTSVMAAVSANTPLPVVGSVSGSVGIVGNPSISGTVNVGTMPGSVIAFQGGTQISSLVNTIPSSVMVSASIFGQLPAGTAMIGSVVAYQGAIPWTIGSVYGNISGSVAAFVVGNASVITVHQGSIAAAQIGTQITSVSGTVVVQSIVGTYAEDAASTSADPGLFVLGVRNDTVASLVSADKDYGAFAQDSAGRQIIKPFVPEDGTIISYVGSVVSTSVTLIQASAIGKRNYVTDIWLGNTGATTTIVQIQDGSTSVLGQLIAPTAGGLSSPGLAIPLRTAPSQDLAFKAVSATSILYLTLKGYQAP